MIQLPMIVARGSVGPMLPHFPIFQELLKIRFVNTKSLDFPNKF